MKKFSLLFVLCLALSSTAYAGFHVDFHIGLPLFRPVYVRPQPVPVYAAPYPYAYPVYRSAPIPVQADTEVMWVQPQRCPPAPVYWYPY